MKAGRLRIDPWRAVLAGGIIMGVSLGARHAFGIFLFPVTMSHGWSRETFSFAIALQNLAWGLAQPFVGMVADRFGAGRIVLAGVVLYAAGLAGMALGNTPLLFTISAGLVVGLALACTTFGVVFGALSRMVEPGRRGWALGLAGAIGGLGQFLIVPISQAFIDALTWRGALVALGLGCLALMPLAARLADSPCASADSPLGLRGAIAEALACRGFWLLNLGFFACGFHLAFIANHLPSYLRDQGMAPSAAVIGLAIIALANVAGTYGFGLLAHRHRPRDLLAWIYASRSLAMAAFYLLPLSAGSLYLFCFAMGFLWLGTVPLTNGVLSRIFGVRYLTTLFGFVFFGHQLGSFLGVWLGGHVFDATRSYDIVWQLGIFIGLAAAALHHFIDDREIRRPALAGAPT